MISGWRQNMKHNLSRTSFIPCPGVLGTSKLLVTYLTLLSFSLSLLFFFLNQSWCFPADQGHEITWGVQQFGLPGTWSIRESYQRNKKLQVECEWVESARKPLLQTSITTRGKPEGYKLNGSLRHHGKMRPRNHVGAKIPNMSHIYSNWDLSTVQIIKHKGGLHTSPHTYISQVKTEYEGWQDQLSGIPY